MKDGFLQTDADFLSEVLGRGKRKACDAGSAAVTVVITAKQLAVAHVGDCRALLVKRDGSHFELSNDHTADLRQGSSMPIRADEAARVRKRGACMDCGYVTVGEKSLPMTRAVGDLPLKVAHGLDWRKTPANQQVVTALPDVMVHDRADDDLCVLLASDGVFGSVMTSAEVAAVLMRLLAEHEGSLDAEKKAANALSEYAYAHHSSDNVGIALVAFHPTSAMDIADCGQEFSQGSSVRTECSSFTAPSTIECKISQPFLKAFPPTMRSRKASRTNERLRVNCLARPPGLVESRRAPGPLAFLPPELRGHVDRSKLYEDLQSF